MKQTLAVIFFLLSACTSYGQNMVVNPSFEQYYQCPTGFSQFTSQYVLGWGSLTQTSTDYYHSCNTSFLGVPVNGTTFAPCYQPAFSGNAYCGAYLFFDFNQNYGGFHEYVDGTLLSLTPNVPYEVTIHVNLRNTAAFAVSNFSVLFYQNGVPGYACVGSICNIPANPQINYNAGVITDTLNWVTLVDTFIADSAYTHLIIGNFQNSTVSNYVQAYPGNYGTGAAYYYFDSISVRPLAPIPLASYPFSTNVNCFNGSTGTASVTGAGGTPPYTYLWLPTNQTTQTVTGLTAGTYTCTITDAASNTNTHVITITQPLSPFNINVNTTSNVLCFGGSNGSAIIGVVGGTFPYTYSWSPNGGNGPSVTNLSSGISTVTVTDANNCITTQTINISQPPAINTSISSTSATCGQQNGTLTVVASGGTPGYTYSWSPYGGTGTTANVGSGTYACTVTDANGCIATIAGTVNSVPSFTLSTTVTNAACFGTSTGTATVTPSGGIQPFTYLWNNGQTTQTATNLAAGNYSVTVTDANGCTGTATVNISQPPLLVANIQSSTNINCYGQSTGAATVTASGGTPGYTYLWSNGATTPNIAGVAAGTYTVTVTDSKGCTANTFTTLTQPPQLNLNIVSSTNASCGQNNGAATVVATGGSPGYTYQWLPTGGTGTSASGLGAGIYTVTVTDTKGCTKFVNITITTSTPLNVNVVSSTNVNCFGGSNGAASITVTGGTQPYTYQWSSGQTTSSVAGLVAGTYSVVVTDVNGCAGSATVTITQPTLLTAVVASQTNVSCFGQNTGTISTAVSGGTPPYIYLWSNGSVAPSIVGLAAGIYTCTVTDAHGCTATLSAAIIQPPALAVSIGSVANATCSQNNGWATATVTGGTQPYTYLWSNGQTAQTINNLSAGNYTCNVTDANGCTGSATVTITASAALTLNIAATNISCNGLSDGTATVAVSTGTQPYTYNWSNGGTTASIYNLTAGSYTINVTDAIGCAGTASIIITEPTALNATLLSSTDALCNGANTGSAEVTASGGTAPYAYLWSNSNTGALQNSLAAGTYTVIATDSNGCTASASVTINQPSAISITAQATASSCAGQAQGSATVSATGGTPPYIYSWNSNPVQSGTTASNLAPGNYTVTATDANGCTQTTTVAIASFPLPTVEAGEDVLYCYGKETAMLHASGAASYVWSPAYGLSCTACQDPVATPAVSTVYTVTGTDTNGCTATDNVTVSVLTKDPTSVGATEDICTGESIQLFASGGSEYSWSPAEGMNDSHIANPTVTPAQSTGYSVIIKQNDCFTDTLTQVVNVHTQPTVSLGPDIKSTAGASIELHADTSNATSITWTPAFNLDCYDCVNPTAFIEKDIRYVVTANNGGCTAVDDINIRISCSESDIFLANSFTPNNDHNNDFFYPQSAYEIPIAYMAVYDRWGEKIFERENIRTNDPTRGWDGTYKGRILEPNVFVYYVQFLCGNGQKVLVKGDVSIVK